MLSRVVWKQTSICVCLYIEWRFSVTQPMCHRIQWRVGSNRYDREGPLYALWFIHSVFCLTTSPYNLPKRVLHRVRASASSFDFQFPRFPLRLFGSCLRLLPRLPVTSILPSIFPSVICFRRQLQRKMWPIRLALLFFVWRIFLSSLTFYNTSSFLTRSVQLIFSILLQHYFKNFPGISDLFSEVSKFHHHTKLHSKCNFLLVPSQKYTQFAGGKSIFFWVVGCFFCHGSPTFNFTCIKILLRNSSERHEESLKPQNSQYISHD
jgi:hypothetical protein